MRVYGRGRVPTKDMSEVPSSGDETETGHALDSVDWEALTAELIFE